jgi:GntR family transcriptional regulator
MELFLSASDHRPMYQQIVDQITAKVMAGDWAPGQSLPSIRELAAASRVSVITVRRAYDDLERAGVIATRHGKGSMVAERSDLATALMHVELQRQLAALLATAARLGLGRADLHRLIDDAAPAAAGTATDTAAASAAPARPAIAKGHTP